MFEFIHPMVKVWEDVSPVIVLDPEGTKRKPAKSFPAYPQQAAVFCEAHVRVVDPLYSTMFGDAVKEVTMGGAGGWTATYTLDWDDESVMFEFQHEMVKVWEEVRPVIVFDPEGTKRNPAKSFPLLPQQTAAFVEPQ
jgi:hypothetical protein